jgi:hypothetical protein
MFDFLDAYSLLRYSVCTMQRIDLQCTGAGMVVRTCNSSTLGTQEGGWGVPGQPGNHSKFNANLSYIVRPYIKKPNKQARHQWLTPVILAIWAVEIRRITV